MLSDKLAKLIKKHGKKVTGDSAKLIAAGIDPTRVSKAIKAKAMVKAGVEESTKAKTNPEKADKSDKKSKKNKTDPKGDKSSKKKVKEAKIEKKSKPDKSENKKVKSSGEHGQRYFMVGHSAASVIRLLGFKGFSRSTCRAAANKFGAKGLSDTTVKCQQYDGTRIKNGKYDKKTGRGIYGKLPEIDKKEISEVIKFCKEYEAKAG